MMIIDLIISLFSVDNDLLTTIECRLNEVRQMIRPHKKLHLLLLGRNNLGVGPQEVIEVSGVRWS